MQNEDKNSPNPDLQQELAEMSEIYSNAILNLGFSAAQSPFDGFSVARQLISQPWIEIPPEYDNEGHSDILINKSTPDFTGLYSPLGESRENMMFTRAWCIQERFLSKRMVHFCKTGIYWECDTLGLTSDVLPVSYRPLRRHGDSPIPFSFHDMSATKVFAESRDPYWWMWNHIIEEYSDMELSWPTKDKLAACGGVAKTLTKLIDDEYVAGFYLRDLRMSLLWKADAGFRGTKSDRHLRSRATEWRAPSWSWASIDGSISSAVLLTSLGSLVSNISVDYELVDSNNPYGALKSASLTLEGWTADVTHSGSPVLKGSVWLRGVELKTYFDDIDEPRDKLIVLLLDGSAYSKLPSSYMGLVLTKVDRGLFSKKQVCSRIGMFDRVKEPNNLARNVKFTRQVLEIL